MFYLSIAMTVVANVAYNLCQKTTSTTVNPLVALSITYAAALVTCLILFSFFSGENTFSYSH